MECYQSAAGLPVPVLCSGGVSQGLRIKIVGKTIGFEGLSRFEAGKYRRSAKQGRNTRPKQALLMRRPCGV
jgi:hypothetical protein